MFSLKKNDRVIISQKNYTYNVTVKSFASYGMLIKENNSIVPFNAGHFYSCGYANGLATFVIKKRGHLIPAKICEFLRLKCPSKLGKLIFGF